jgi:hypothetical protein
MRTESHNTVLINGENQDPKAEAPVTAFDATPEGVRAVIDLRGAYATLLERHDRSVDMIRRKQIVITDAIQAKQPVEVLWGMVTEAAVALDGRRAVLSKDGKKLVAEIRSPEGAAFEIIPTQPPQPQRQNEGTRKLAVKLPAKIQATKIVVALTPQ